MFLQTVRIWGERVLVLGLYLFFVGFASGFSHVPWQCSAMQAKRITFLLPHKNAWVNYSFYVSWWYRIYQVAIIFSLGFLGRFTYLFACKFGFFWFIFFVFRLVLVLFFVAVFCMLFVWLFSVFLRFCRLFLSWGEIPKRLFFFTSLLHLFLCYVSFQ